MSETNTRPSNLKLFLFVVVAAFVAAFVSAFSQELLLGKTKVWITLIVVLAVVFGILQLGWRRNKIT